MYTCTSVNNVCILFQTILKKVFDRPKCVDLIKQALVELLVLFSSLYTLIIIRKTCPCNVYPIEPHFYIAKLEYAGVYLFFLFLLKNIDYRYSLEPPHGGGSTLYKQSMF